MNCVDITEFLKHLYEMENVIVTEVNDSMKTVRMGESKTIGLCSNYDENLEILYEDDSYLLITKSNIKSILEDDISIRLDMADGSYYLFEQI